MLKSIKFLVAATAFSLAAIPAAAQEAEEPRTTYAVTAFSFTDDADQNRWLEVMDTYINPARVAAGMAPETVHWVMLGGDYDIILIAELPDGMHTFDSHTPASRMAFVSALTDLVGGEEELAALNEEMSGMTKDSTTLYTHTPP